MQDFVYECSPPDARNPRLLVSVLELVLRRSQNDTMAVNEICDILSRWGGTIDRTAIEEARRNR